MTTKVLAPHRFRRRLTVAFVVLGAAAAALVALASIVLMERYREQAFLQRARQTVELNVALTPRDLTLEDLPPLLAAFREQGSFETVTVVDGAVASSDTAFDLSVLPPVGSDVGDDGIDVEVGGRRYLLLAGEDHPDAELYFFFPRDPLEASLDRDAEILAFVSLAVALVAALAGALIARRTLAPVTRAATAAQLLSEGLLDTRLETDRRDEFGLWAESFNQMAAALEQKIDDLAAARDRERQLTADVAHDLRTPVAALLAEAELLRSDATALPESARRLAELLCADAARLVALIEDLLELAALDGGRAEVVVDHVELDRVVRDVVDVAAPEGTIDMEVAHVVAETDRRRFSRIVLNLVTNAVRHGAGEARVSLREDDGAVLFEVADRGPGIDPEHLPLIFDRFYRADTARSGTGTGLGLAIAKEDARLLGGDLTVESVRGEGAVFTLCLPVDGRGTGVDGAPPGGPRSWVRPRSGAQPSQLPGA